MKNKIIYRLTIEDIQQVAKENYGRELAADEIERIIDPIGDQVPWYGIIDGAINYSLGLKKIV